MSKFYLYLWLRWALRLTLSSLTLALVSSLSITLFIYTKQGLSALTPEVTQALLEITQFWFAPLWGISLLYSLFRGMKYLFNFCINGYRLELRYCPKEGNSEAIDPVGDGDVVKVWRKWLLLLIWLIGSQMILITALKYFLNSNSFSFNWFNIYVLYGFILLAGYFSFMILSVRCKRVRLVKCSSF